MKRPETCMIEVEKCEDCKFWEPIPFHHRGGECIPTGEMTRVEIFVHTSLGNPGKVPVEA